MDLPRRPGIQDVLRWFERAVAVILAVMMAVVVVFAVVELAVILVQDIVSRPLPGERIPELLTLFGMFLLVLIGVELLETIKTYVVSRVLRVEVVLMAATLAVARKVIILDLGKTSELTLFGIAALLVALAGAYFLYRRSRKADASADEVEEASPAVKADEAVDPSRKGGPTGSD